MGPSPLTSLVSKRVCLCSSSSRRVTAQQAIRSITSSSAGLSQHWTPSHGSPELLKRRYQTPRKEIDKTQQRIAGYKTRMRYAAFGIVGCAIGLFATIYLYPQPDNNVTKLDAPSLPGIPDTSLEEQKEQIPTGTSTIPFFPRTLHLSEVAAPADAAAADRGEQEYQLVGLGIRKVLYIQVYVVGLYIAVPDIEKLQARLVHTVDEVATTLVPAEKEKLKSMLLDPVQSEEVWNSILKDGGIRTVLKIVPTRNTDFAHLRDGWTRGIAAKTQSFASKGDKSLSDESFGSALNEFKTVLGGGFSKKVPWGETVLLTRDGEGVLSGWYENKKGDKLHLGTVKDERISRMIWLIYLGGAKVSAEELRKNVVDGVMEYVERPVGTVATQVI